MWWVSCVFEIVEGLVWKYFGLVRWICEDVLSIWYVYCFDVDLGMVIFFRLGVGVMFDGVDGRGGSLVYLVRR